MLIGVVTGISYNKDELISLVSEYDSLFEGRNTECTPIGKTFFCGQSHWHSDKMPLFICDISDEDLEDFLSELRSFEDCHGVFEVHDEDNPLDPLSRVDLYAREGTFFGEQSNINNELGGMQP